MCHIVSESYNKPKGSNLNLYHELIEVCLTLKHQKFFPKKTSDVGSRKFPRFQTSNCIVYTEEETIIIIDSLHQIFKYHSSQMIDIDQSGMNNRDKMLHKLKLFNTLKTEINKFKGFGEIRSCHLICLSSLLGLIPIDFYIYMPLHFNGGVKTFLEEKCNIKNSDSFLDWNVDTVLQIQKVFSSKLTPNMLENSMCIISRKSTKVDPFYYLPYIDKTTKRLVYGSKMQLMFRLNGIENKKYVIEAFNGSSIHTMMSKEHSILNRFKLSTDNKHIENWVDTIWIKDILSIN